MMYLERTRIDRVLGVALTGRGGFTLIEVLIVMVIIGILLTISVPAYIGFSERAANMAAKANIRSAIPAAEMFAEDNTGAKGDADNKKSTKGYKGMTADLLRDNYDPGIAESLTVVSAKTNDRAFCLTATVGGQSWSARGPGIGAASYKNNAKCK